MAESGRSWTLERGDVVSEKRRLRRYAEAARSAKRKHLETEAKGELLDTRNGECRAVLAQCSAGEFDIEATEGSDRIGIEANGIGSVEDFPRELQGNLLADLPRFGETD